MKRQPKIAFLIADGMGDWPLAELGGRTPLDAAATPNMDALAMAGMIGQCRTVPPGVAPGSDVANMALLGYDPVRFHTGRGPMEAAAQGLVLSEEDLVWRLNLVTMSGQGASGRMLDYSAGHIDSATSKPLILDLQEHLGDETFTFVPGVQYRHLLIQKGGASAVEASIEIRPPHDITDRPILPDLEAYARSPVLPELLRRAGERLAGNPSAANAIWPWGQGRPLHLPSFEERFGLSGAVISAVDVVKGLGRATGMEVPEVEGATGLLDTNYEGKVEAALRFLEHGDFVFLHVEAPDECGHGGDPEKKIEAIARFDARIVGPMREALRGEPTAFVIACDHLTPIAERTHVPDPVPFLLACPGCQASGLSSFTEDTASSSGLLIEPGHGLLGWVLRTVRENAA